MRSVYDNVKVVSTVGPILITGTLAGTASTGSAVDTKGYNSGMIYASAGKVLTGGGTLTVTVDESADNSTWTQATDNGGTAIGFTLVTTSAFNEGQARIESLGGTRKRYLRGVATFAASATSTSTVVATIVLGRAFAVPTNTSVSNT